MLLVGEIDGDVFLARLNADGSVVFRRALDNRHDTSGGSVTPTPYGEALDRGFDAIEKPGGDSISGFSRGMPLFMTDDGGAIVAASSDSFGGRSEFWLVKLNRTGGIPFPYRANLEGSSYVNEHSRSNPLTDFSSEISLPVPPLAVDSEVTPLEVGVQSP